MLPMAAMGALGGGGLGGGGSSDTSSAAASVGSVMGPTFGARDKTGDLVNKAVVALIVLALIAAAVKLTGTGR